MQVILPSQATSFAISPSSSVDDVSFKHTRPSKPWASTSSCSDSEDKSAAKDDDIEASSSSDVSDDDHGYATDYTTPTASDLCPDERYMDEVEAFRDHEYPMMKGSTYLDTGGSMIHAASLIQRFSADMLENLYGNPHSASSPSARAGHRVDAVREKALRFFNANPDEWDLVFTANASAAIKLVTECIRDHAASTNTPVWYGYHRDSHTSLVGAREMLNNHRCFTSDDEVDIWINSGGFGGARPRQIGLFAYPGQSNMTGRRLPLSWCGRIRKQIYKAPTYTLLDAAALASTASIDLSDTSTAPDFIALSWYKIFGFPNIGALLVRKASAHVLEGRKFFGGGTVDMVIAINDSWHAKKDSSIHDRLEDGTLPFHSIFALDHAIDVHETLYGPEPMKFISNHTSQLARRLFDGLSKLRHANGLPVVVMYADPGTVYGDPTTQGATIAFNVRRANGEMIGYEEVEQAADREKIYVRSGSLCNPGGMATYLGWSPAEMRKAYESGHRCSNPTQVLMGKSTGVVRVSLGGMNIAADVCTFLDFMERTYVNKDASVALPKIDCSSTFSSPRLSSSGSTTPTVNTTVASPRSIDTVNMARPAAESLSNPASKLTKDPPPQPPMRELKSSLMHRRSVYRKTSGVNLAKPLEVRIDRANAPRTGPLTPTIPETPKTGDSEDHHHSGARTPRHKHRFGRGVAALLRKPSESSPRLGGGSMHPYS
ncbi:PLP-dependent transferase [Myriangium duriaei CBS 260.36]|uniref:PLP-dependent transferase n=1 Tax=Myriangium duriaei CBS 260.36 TaxID=1168546 RepID=A0A9P4IZ10_9PEZI|nr:PLP-dependent transferase [Myriangium duriaei CBS 260.36]